ncbi:MAG: hypothetical protein P8Y97_13440, partial [Candidatus Lokiarchaeota archaeon]
YSIPGIIFLLFNLVLLAEFIAFGIINRRISISDLSSDIIRRRRAQISNLTNTVRRTTNQSRNSRARPLQSTTSRRSSSKVSRSKPRSKARRTTALKSSTKSKRKISRSSLSKMRPKAGTLNIDDFKCIFCFNLPKLPEDRGRGIVLCPVCKYPAHADEFKDWTQTSDLCSRCGAKISSSYRRNPKKIPVRIYIQAIRYLLKNEKKK